MNTNFRERNLLLYSKVKDDKLLYINRTKKAHMYKYHLKSYEDDSLILIAKNNKLSDKISLYINDIEYGSIRYNLQCNVYKLYNNSILNSIFFYKNKQFQFNFPNNQDNLNMFNIEKFETENCNVNTITSKKNKKVFHKNKLIFSLSKIGNDKFDLQISNPMSYIQSFALSVIMMHKFSSYI